MSQEYKSKSLKQNSSKMRLDAYLVEFGLAENLKIASSLIVQGCVYQDTKKLPTKVGTLVKTDTAITIKIQKKHNYVSRGALKLAHAVEYFKINITDFNCLDVGCSTGGFSEILLKNNVKHVYAVDVGYGEFDWRLRNSSKVTLYERTNARFLTAEHIKEPLDLIVCDASFISLTMVLESAIKFLKKHGQIVALIKPQFEATKEQVGIKGIIRDTAVHEQVCSKIQNWLESKNFTVNGIVESPITGMKGNKEFLIMATFNE